MPRRKAEETLTDKKRKMMVEDILTRGLEQGNSLAKCWLLTHPESKAKPESARVMAQRQIGWYLGKYPTGYEQLVRRWTARERRRHRRIVERAYREQGRGVGGQADAAR